jgi:hypothetical protein
MDWYWSESIVDKFDFFTAVVAKGHRRYFRSFTLLGLEFIFPLTQGGARFKSLALGYFLSGFQPCELGWCDVVQIAKVNTPICVGEPTAEFSGPTGRKRTL